MKLFIRITSAAIVSAVVMLGLVVNPASAASPPQVATNEAGGKSHVVVDGTTSDANLQTPTVNSRIIIQASGGDWAWSGEFTYYPQRMNVYEVPSVLGDMKWHIVDTRDPNVYIVSGNLDTRFPEEQVIDVYGADGYYEVNGRQWMTECESYSQTERCRTDIWATQAKEVSPGVYANVNGWVFNNLTYLPSPRSLWVSNPLGGYGQSGYEGTWTAEDGRQWRVQCDTSLSGRGGCRADIEATVIEYTGGSFRKVDKWLFNNIVRFS